MTEGGDVLSESDRIRAVYETDYSVEAAQERSARWSPRNLTALYQRHQVETELVRALNAADIELRGADILDVGCGPGVHLRLFAELGADADRLHGIDLVPERIELAQHKAPAMHFSVVDATAMPFADHSFDVVSQFAALCNITDSELRRRAAQEMARVLRPGGTIVWFDIARARADAHYIGISGEEIKGLFPGFDVVIERPLFHRWTEVLAPRIPELAATLERLPLAKTNLLAVLRGHA